MQRSLVPASLLCAALAFVAACETHSASEIRSNWDVLRSAKPKACEPLPKSDKEINVQFARPMSGTPTTLLLQHRSRAGLPVISYAPFTGAIKIPYEALKPLNMTASVVILGGGSIHGKPYVVVSNRFAGKNRIELRDLATQNVEMGADWPFEIMRPVAFHAMGERGFWVAYKIPKEEESIEDQPIILVHGRKAEKGEGLVLRRFALPPDVTRIQLLKTGPDRVLALWASETKAADGVRTLFQAQEFFDNGGSHPAQALKFQVKGGIESWGAAGWGNQVYVAFVEGDSLMGEASLRTVKVDWRSVGSKVAWDRKALLPHEHVADPQVLPHGAGAKVILLKWLDRESTLGVYRYDGEGNVTSDAVGVFPEGTQLAEAFYANDQDSFQAILRTKVGLVEDLVLCRVE